VCVCSDNSSLIRYSVLYTRMIFSHHNVPSRRLLRFTSANLITFSVLLSVSLHQLNSIDSQTFLTFCNAQCKNTAIQFKWTVRQRWTNRQICIMHGVAQKGRQFHKIVLWHISGVLGSLVMSLWQKYYCWDFTVKDWNLVGIWRSCGGGKNITVAPFRQSCCYPVVCGSSFVYRAIMRRSRGVYRDRHPSHDPPSALCLSSTGHHVDATYTRGSARWKNLTDSKTSPGRNVVLYEFNRFTSAKIVKLDSVCPYSRRIFLDIILNYSVFTFVSVIPTHSCRRV